MTDAERAPLDDGISLRRRMLNVRTIGSLLFGLLLLFLLSRVVFGDNFDWGEVGRLIGQANPGFLALAFIELVDLIFAVDSVPAIFAITQDPFIVYTSNIFAILGLRAMYFLLAGIIDKFHYLKYGLAIVLLFVGVVF